MSDMSAEKVVPSSPPISLNLFPLFLRHCNGSFQSFENKKGGSHGRKSYQQDIELLSHIAENKYLSVIQHAALGQRTIQLIRRRLRLLLNEHPITMKERGFGQGPGRRGNIIVLTEKGLEWLNENGILSSHATYVTGQTPESLFLDHDLLVNWVLIHLINTGPAVLRLGLQYPTIYSHGLKVGDAEKPLLMEQFSNDESKEDTYSMIPDVVFKKKKRGQGCIFDERDKEGMLVLS